MAKFWLMHPGGGGPVLVEEQSVLDKISSGALTGKDVVCPEGETKWIPVGEKFTLPAPAPVPPPISVTPTPAAELPKPEVSEEDEPESGPETPVDPTAPVAEADRCMIFKGTDQHCTNRKHQRGICQAHYAALKRLIKKGLTTWVEQEKKGVILGKEKTGPRANTPRLGAMASAFITAEEFVQRSGKTAAGKPDPNQPSLL